KVLDYIHAHLDEELSVDTLSRIAHFSRFHFHRQFSDYTGITVTRLVQMLRLRRASLQLVFNKRARITDIAFQAGFANAESFSRAFRRILFACVSPRAWPDADGVPQQSQMGAVAKRVAAAASR